MITARSELRHEQVHGARAQINANLDPPEKDESQDTWSDLEYLDHGTDEFGVSDKSDVD